LPAATQIVSPVFALSTAACIGVVLALSVPPSRHQPDWLTQMSPSLQENAAAVVVDTAMIAKIRIVVVTISRIFTYSPYSKLPLLA